MEAIFAQVKNAMPEPLWNLLVLLVAIGTAIWTVVRCFVFVKPGMVGVRTRFGKPIIKYPKKDDAGQPYTKQQIQFFKSEDKKLIQSYRHIQYGKVVEVHPGFNPLLPFVHGVEMVDIRRNNVALGVQRIIKPDDYIAYDLEEITLDIRLFNVFLWLMASIDAEAQVKAIADTQLSSILCDCTIEQVRRNDPIIGTRLIEETAIELRLLGVVLEPLALKLGPVKPEVAASFRSRAEREVAAAIQGKWHSGT
jgi:regulator of protease activity HflC (stomatin/prohibitin superfamily)